MIPFTFGTMCGASLACGNLGAAIVFALIGLAAHVGISMTRMAK